MNSWGKKIWHPSFLLLQGLVISQLVCVFTTAMNVVYINLMTQNNFLYLGFNYFNGPKRNGSFQVNADWIETVIPKEAYCDIIYKFQSGSQSELSGICAFQWAQPLQIFLTCLWFGYACLIIVEVLSFVVTMMNIMCPCFLRLYKM